MIKSTLSTRSAELKISKDNHPIVDYTPITMNQIIKKGLLIAALVVAACSLTLAHSSERDFGANISVDLEKKLTKRLVISLSEVVSLKDDFRSFDKFGSTLGLGYRLVKNHLKIGASYSALLTDKVDYLALNNRISGQLTGSTSAGIVDFALRAKYQATFKNTTHGQTYKHNPKQDLRGKFTISFNLSRAKIYPFASAELYYGLQQRYITKKVYMVGIDKKFDKHNAIGISFELSDKVKQDVFYVNVGYTHRF